LSQHVKDGNSLEPRSVCPACLPQTDPVCRCRNRVFSRVI
jgi:hypothetical protein